MLGLFKPKPKKIISKFQLKAFKAWGVSTKDIATELRFKTALGVYTSIFLSVSFTDRPQVERLSKKIFRHLTDTVENKRCKVSEIFSIQQKVKCVDYSQSAFLIEAGIDNPSTNMNGYAIMHSLSQVIGQDCAVFLQGRDSGDFLNAGILMLRDLSIGGIDGDVISGIQVAKDFSVFCDEMVKVST